jgi:hypothetical protein
MNDDWMAEPLYCTCDTPTIDSNDQCILCLRAHKPTVYDRYGWTLNEDVA